ncbi:unnamed protein product [Durusdinium trenchii]|uniref:Uncharacterized protein n=1 Tax=Durusdinium trenchii TaxID=1381693 RepID=A0ABP0KI92_9DINO
MASHTRTRSASDILEFAEVKCVAPVRMDEWDRKTSKMARPWCAWSPDRSDRELNRPSSPVVAPLTIRYPAQILNTSKVWKTVKACRGSRRLGNKVKKVYPERLGLAPA